MGSKSRLALFDIDKTLIKSSKGHITAFSEAFKKVYGLETSINIINYHGMTDQQIITEVLKKNGLDEQTIKSKLKDCMQAMVESFNETLESDKTIALDGVRELVEALHRRHVLMGLVTGNLEAIGRGKLKKVGLNHFFKVGGFGSDDINRTKLAKLAIKRAEEKFKFIFRDNAFLFGDAPQDIKAGKEAGIKTVGVTTGVYSGKQLRAAGADFVLNDLKETDKILTIVC